MAHRHFSKSITPVFPRIGSWFNNLGGSQVPASLCFRFVGSCFMLCPGPEASLSAKQVLTSSELARRQQGPPHSLMAAPSVYPFSAMRAGAYSPLTPDSATNALRLLGWKNIAIITSLHNLEGSIEPNVFPTNLLPEEFNPFFFIVPFDPLSTSALACGIPQRLAFSPFHLSTSLVSAASIPLFRRRRRSTYTPRDSISAAKYRRRRVLTTKTPLTPDRDTLRRAPPPLRSRQNVPPHHLHNYHPPASQPVA